MAYYRECPHCGCNLDPGELCDCRSEKKEAASTHMETTSKRIQPAAIVLHSSTRVKEAMR